MVTSSIVGVMIIEYKFFVQKSSGINPIGDISQDKQITVGDFLNELRTKADLYNPNVELWLLEAFYDFFSSYK